MLRRLPLPEAEAAERDAGAVDAQLLPRAAEVREVIPQGLGPGEDEIREAEDLMKREQVGRFFKVDSRIRAMEGDDCGQAFAAEEGEKVHGDVAEIHVQEGCLVFFQKGSQTAGFPVRDEDRTAQDRFLPEAPCLPIPRRAERNDRVKGKIGSVLPLAGDNDRAIIAESSNLPVDVQHLRLQKRREELRGNGFFR